jgi:hypothetical protein
LINFNQVDIMLEMSIEDIKKLSRAEKDVLVSLRLIYNLIKNLINQLLNQYYELLIILCNLMIKFCFSI